MSVEIPLTQGQIALVDDVDADVKQFKWGVGFHPNYAEGGRFIAQRGNKGKTEFLHRFIAARKQGRPLSTKEVVDHINRNTLDNRRCNLRVASQSQNCGNRKKSQKSTSGYKGVSFYKALGKWGAFIGQNSKTKYLGLFPTPEEAAKAYDAAAREYFGEFALVNFPGDES